MLLVSRTLAMVLAFAFVLAGCTTFATISAGKHLQQGNALLAVSDFDGAIAEYTEVIRLKPMRSVLVAAYSIRGTTYNAKGEYDLAIADFTEVIRLDPNATWYLGRGNAYRSKGEYDRAIADYTEAIRLNPDLATVGRLGRGNAYHAKGDYDRAIADFTEVIRLDPYLAAAYFARSAAYDATGDTGNASADLVWAHFHRGNAYYDDGEYDLAIADYTEMIRILPLSASYYFRGLAYYEKREYARARADWEKALELDPDLVEARDSLERLRREGR